MSNIELIDVGSTKFSRSARESNISRPPYDGPQHSRNTDEVVIMTEDTPLIPRVANPIVFNESGLMRVLSRLINFLPSRNTISLQNIWMFLNRMAPYIAVILIFLIYVWLVYLFVTYIVDTKILK